MGSKASGGSQTKKEKMKVKEAAIINRTQSIIAQEQKKYMTLVGMLEEQHKLHVKSLNKKYSDLKLGFIVIASILALSTTAFIVFITLAYS